MRVEMVMPQMGESIAEATVLKWLKDVGDKVRKDETILEISTDKVDSEIPSPAAGTIVELRAKEGEVVPVKSVIAVIDTDASAAKPSTNTGSQTAAGAQTNGQATAEKATSQPTPSPQQAPDVRAAAPQPTLTFANSVPEQSASDTSAELPSHIGERFYSPLVRSLAAENGITSQELQAITGTGAQARVTKADVMNYLKHRSNRTQIAPMRVDRSSREATAQSARIADAPRLDYGPQGTRSEPMDHIRKRIAEHMVRSKATSPHVYSTTEVDMTAIAKWRESHQKDFVAREGFKLSFTPFFLEAVTKALVQFPYVNASVDGENIVLKKGIHLGCAVALGSGGGTGGLIVPVIKNADQLSLVGLARALNDLAARARAKKLVPDETQGGTFTLTNPGIFGNIIGCPIINQPQLGILATGAIKKRPVVVNDMIAVRDMVYLTLSYDHRVIDGALSGQFLQFIAKYLEGWDSDRELY